MAAIPRMSNEDNNPFTQKYKPTYADEGRRQRVEGKGNLATLHWHEHCLATNRRSEPLADDRLSTRESCCKPDMLTDGIATELMITDWGNEPFPFIRMNIPMHKLRYVKDYPDGVFVLMNLHGTYAVSCTMEDAMKYDQEAYYPDAEGNPMLHARLKVEFCHTFKLEKIDKMKN